MWSRTQYMQSLLEIRSPFLGFLVISMLETYLARLSPRLFASPWTPSRWKKNSFWVQRRGWLVCESPEKTCWLCVRSLRSATPRFSLLFSRGEESSERHRFRAHTATHAFPCQQSGLALSRLSRSVSIPACSFFHNLSQQIFSLSHKFVPAVTECLHKSECCLGLRLRVRRRRDPRNKNKQLVNVVILNRSKKGKSNVQFIDTSRLSHTKYISASLRTNQSFWLTVYQLSFQNKRQNICFCHPANHVHSFTIRMRRYLSTFPYFHSIQTKPVHKTQYLLAV